MRKTNLLIVLLILGLLGAAVSACQPITAASAPKAAAPQSGNASVSGRLVRPDGSTPHPETMIRLAEVYREGGEGAFILDGANSPGDTTDENGYFVIENIPAGEYVVVVGDPLDVYVIISDENGQAKTWDAPADQITDYGAIQVDYNPR